jgi:hypothetical protein
MSLFFDQLLSNPAGSQVVDWIGRVRQSGGNDPSPQTILSLQRFY